jgi:hypothetical protein
MKYLLFMLLSCFGMGVHALPMVSLNPSSSLLGFNEAFTVDVVVSGIESTDQLIAFGFDIDADFGLTFQGATVALPFLDDSSFFPTTEVAGSTFPSIFGDNILLNTLSFTTGTTNGLLNLAVSTSLLDFGFSEGLFTIGTVYDIGDTAAVEVRGISTVPMPSTLLLIVLGLFCVGRRSQSP